MPKKLTLFLFLFIIVTGFNLVRWDRRVWFEYGELLSISSSSSSWPWQNEKDVHSNDNGANPPVSLESDWQNWGKQLSRVWKPQVKKKKNDNYSWCIRPHDEFYATRFLRGANRLSHYGKKKFVRGLIYVKSPKTGSSTGVGITLRMAERVAARKWGEDNTTTFSSSSSSFCTVNYTHPFAFHKGHGRRTDPSLLWTQVRHPAKQSISMFFHFFVHRKKMEPNALNLIQTMTNLKNAQTSYLSPTVVQTQNLMSQDLGPDHPGIVLVHNILTFYDFIAVLDRMDESLVAMKMLFHLKHGDILVLPSKKSGDYVLEASGGQKNLTCVRTAKAFDIPGTASYIANEHWLGNLDYVLFAAANHSLDLTIDGLLGRRQFQRELEIHRFLYRWILQQCSSEAQQCSPDGTPQVLSKDPNHCYVEDAGCGHACVDRALAKYPELAQR